MCNNFFRFVPAPIFGKENLPATKYLDCDIMLFWWLEKNKDLTTKQMLDELYSLICNRINDPITYKELKSKKLGLDTKGIIPVQVLPMQGTEKSRRQLRHLLIP